MLSPTEILVYFIFGSVVLLTGKLAIVGVYPLAAGIALPLLAFGYLVRWDGRSIEERLIAPPRHGRLQSACLLSRKIASHPALCGSFGLTSWQRDRAICTMVKLDLTAFGSQRVIPKVALVVIRHIVDREREHHLGLHDEEWIADQPPERLFVCAAPANVLEKACVPV